MWVHWAPAEASSPSTNKEKDKLQLLWINWNTEKSRTRNGMSRLTSRPFLKGGHLGSEEIRIPTVLQRPIFPWRFQVIITNTFSNHELEIGYFSWHLESRDIFFNIVPEYPWFQRVYLQATFHSSWSVRWSHRFLLSARSEKWQQSLILGRQNLGHLIAMTTTSVSPVKISTILKRNYPFPKG